MKAHFINIGRGKFCGFLEVKNSDDILEELSKHLLSSSIELVYKNNSNEAIVLVGGFRPVGKVKLEGGVFKTTSTEKGIIKERE